MLNAAVDCWCLGNIANCNKFNRRQHEILHNHSGDPAEHVNLLITPIATIAEKIARDGIIA
jgi:hypothetical protein